jgi:regulator of cell morphogenesis and NO signaling
MDNNINNLLELSLSEIVKNDFHAAAVFEKFNLDFCCRGNKTISETCKIKGINSEEVINELQSLQSNNEMFESKYTEWDLSFLIDYIINNHHEYVRRMIPVISMHLDKVASVHGKNHPEMNEVKEKYNVVYKDLKQHMLKEEQILFPYIKQMVKANKEESKSEPPFFGTVKNPITMMKNEHQAAGDEMYDIRNLTNNYNPPEDACSTFKVLLKELKEFEEDLHKHVHLENNILFPKSIILEEELIPA